MNPIKKTITLADGREITLETGKLAKQADGAVELRMGNTMLLATVVSAKEAGEGVDFMPLQVEYKEKFSAAGRYPGGFQKREGRSSDYEILTSRLVDRVLRPLFPENYHADTFVNIIMFSSDGVDIPDALAGLAASAAIAVSDVPFHGPISEVRVARVDGEFVINPTFEQVERADIELMVGATYDNIMMVEGEMNEVSELELLEALKAAHEAIKAQCLVQMELAKEVGAVKREYCHEVNDEDLRKDVHDKCYEKAYAVAKAGSADKQWRNESFKKIEEDYLETIPEEERDEKAPLVKRYYHDVEREAVRRCILDEGIRLDGRKTTEIRPIWCETDYLPGPHGSAVFTCGETQALATVTLGTKMDEKILDDVLNQGRERFLLHYNFPPFSVGEVKPVRLSRREIGHGALAEKALLPVIPSVDEFPYAIRVVSEVVSSNGSTSQGSICGSTLALMDAGVPIKAPVAGISCGLITEGDRWMTMLDIQGVEDFHGDMDFKVGGTRKGITAIQMDIKIDGLTYDIIAEAFEKCRKGRLYILDEIIKPVIAEPRHELSRWAPKMFSMMIPTDKIKDVIGKGGKVIQDICATCNCKIDVQEDGHVFVSAVDQEDAKRAIFTIKTIVEDPEIGAIYKGKVTRLMNFGAFVEIAPGKEGLVHISKLDTKRVERVEDVVAVGDAIVVKVTDIDQQGRINLSRRDAILALEAKKAQQEQG